MGQQLAGKPGARQQHQQKRRGGSPDGANAGFGDVQQQQQQQQEYKGNSSGTWQAELILGLLTDSRQQQHKSNSTARHLAGEADVGVGDAADGFHQVCHLLVRLPQLPHEVANGQRRRA